MKPGQATAAQAELARMLGAPPTRMEFLAPLSDAQRVQLAADIERARKAYASHIRERMAEALNHIPWLLRGPVKKLFGK